MRMCPGERGTHCRGCRRRWRERLRAYVRCSRGGVGAAKPGGGGVADPKIGSRRARLSLVVVRGGLTRLVG
jgi:hypothetical protein